MHTHMTSVWITNAMKDARHWFCECPQYAIKVRYRALPLSSKTDFTSLNTSYYSVLNKIITMQNIMFETVVHQPSVQMDGIEKESYIYTHIYNLIFKFQLSELRGEKEYKVVCGSLHCTHFTRGNMWAALEMGAANNMGAILCTAPEQCPPPADRRQRFDKRHISSVLFHFCLLTSTVNSSHNSKG